MPEGRLRPEEVASLDPYSVRESSAVDTAKELLEEPKKVKKTKVQEHTESEETLFEFQEILREDEEKAWEKVLGSPITVYSPPDEITKGVVTKLWKMGMELRYVPNIRFAEHPIPAELHKSYPNWRSVEDLLPAEMGNWDNVRNLEAKFWEKVRKGKVQLPQGGYWVAVEEGSLDFQHGYMDGKTFPLSRVLGITSRHASYVDVKRILESRKPDILNSVGLSLTEGSILRVPNALEYNLLMNRDRFHGVYTGYTEWTSTDISTLTGRHNFTMGSAGGASAMEEHNSKNIDYGVDGFRVLIEFRQPGVGIGKQV